MPKKYPQNLMVYEEHDDVRVGALCEVIRTLKKMGYVGIGLELDESLSEKEIEQRVINEIRSIKTLLSKTHTIANAAMRTGVREKLLGSLIGYAKYLLIIQHAKEIGLKIFAFDMDIAELRRPGFEVSKRDLYSFERETTMAKNVLKASMLYGGPVLCLAGLNHRPGLETYLGENIVKHMDFDELLSSKSVDEEDMPKALALNILKRTSPIFTVGSFLDALKECLSCIPNKEVGKENRVR